MEFRRTSLFPNDEVEVPYLIVSAFLVCTQTGDQALLDEIYPMLKWAFEVQLPQLGWRDDKLFRR